MHISLSLSVARSRGRGWHVHPLPLAPVASGATPSLSPSLAPPVEERGTFFHALSLSFSSSSVLALDSLTMHTPCRNDYPRSPPLETRTESQTETERCRRCIFAFTLLILSPDVSPTLPPRFSLSRSLSVARRPSGLPERISVSVSITPLASAAAAGSHGISGDHHMRHRPVSSLLPVFPHIHEDSFPNSSCHHSRFHSVAWRHWNAAIESLGRTSYECVTRSCCLVGATHSLPATLSESESEREAKS